MKVVALIGIGLTVVGIVSCQRRVNDSARREVLSSFRHKPHEESFKSAAINCSNCHMMQIASPGKLSGELLYPGRQECHSCHNNPEKSGPAPQLCDTCHKDLRAIMPDDHKIGWMSGHAAPARLDQERCDRCHRTESCSDCHLKRDSIRERMHDRNFLYSHSIEGRGDPHRCTTCHTVSFCKDCHAVRGVTE